MKASVFSLAILLIAACVVAQAPAVGRDTPRLSQAATVQIEYRVYNSDTSSVPIRIVRSEADDIASVDELAAYGEGYYVESYRDGELLAPREPLLRPSEPMDVPELIIGNAGEDLRINSDVGIGIDDPLAKLHVIGTIRSDGNTGLSYQGITTSGDGANNRAIEAQDYTQWIWNTSSTWGLFWAGSDGAAYSHFGTTNPNEYVFVGGGNARASIDGDNGNMWIGGDSWVGGGNLYIGNDAEWRDGGTNTIYTPDNLNVDGRTYSDGFTNDGTMDQNGTADFNTTVDIHGTLHMNNNNIDEINHMIIVDPGANEGLGWGSTAAGWIIDVSPTDRSNSDGNLNLYGTANNVAIWRPIDMRSNQITNMACDGGTNDAATCGWVNSHDDNTTYSAGNDIDISGTTISVEDDIDETYVRTYYLFDRSGPDWGLASCSGGASVGTSGEDLAFIEPESSNKVWAYIQDDWGLHLTGAPNLHVTGNVGIGTTSPTVGGSVKSSEGDNITPKLHIYSNTNNVHPTLHISCENNDEAILLLSENSSSNGYGAKLWYEGSGNNFFNIGIGDAGTWTNRFTIDRYGKVGIGTTSPEYKLHVVSGSDATPIYGYKTCGAGNTAAVWGASGTRNIGKLGGENSSGDPIGSSYNYGVYGYVNNTGWGGHAGVFTNSNGNWAILGGGSAGSYNYAGYFNGDVRVTGKFYDSSGDAGSDGQVLSSTGSGTDWIDGGGGPVVGCATPPYGDQDKGAITFTTSTQYAPYNAGERPFWHFAATAGVTYSISFCSNSEDSYLRLYDSSCSQVASNDDSGPYCSGVPSSIAWSCPTTGNYTVQMTHYSTNTLYNSGTIAYWRSARRRPGGPAGGESDEYYAKGSGSLEDGEAAISFDPDFSEILSDDPPVVVVTPTGPCNTIYIDSVDNSGFTVVENRGASNTSFNWVAIADPPKPSWFDEHSEDRISLKDMFYADPSARTYDEWVELFAEHGITFPFTIDEYKLYCYPMRDTSPNAE